LDVAIDFGVFESTAALDRDVVPFGAVIFAVSLPVASTRCVRTERALIAEGRKLGRRARRA
jgi:hypothetical protein